MRRHTDGLLSVLYALVMHLLEQVIRFSRSLRKNVEVVLCKLLKRKYNDIVISSKNTFKGINESTEKSCGENKDK